MKCVHFVITLVIAALLSGCGGADIYEPEYDKGYQQYKMEKKMEHELEKEYSPKEMQDLEKNLKKKYGK